MELALLVYFASVVGSVSNLLGFSAYMLFCISAAFIMALLTVDISLNIKSVLTKSIKWTIPLTIIFALLSVLLPTERTVYLMTAAYATQTLAQNDRVQKIGSDVLEVVENKLSEMKGNDDDNSK